ncbi:MAG: proline racemase family protein [Bacteroidales bacterium]|nr:proline racemase family protein [Bacteroidales bacterium]
MKKNCFLKTLKNWKPTEDWKKIITIDAHTAGEPLRIISGAYPEPEGKTMLEKRRFAKENFDNLRKLLMWEPRGHADMYGAIITPPVSENADFGVLFIHNEGYSSMCGHGIIALTKVALETGMIRMKSPETTIRIDTPSGLVTSYACIENNKVKSVYFHNVPSFVYTMNETVEVKGIGKVKYHIAFGGAFYAFVDADELGISMALENVNQLIDYGMKIKREVMKTKEINHPIEDDLGFLYGTIFYGKAHDKVNDSRNVCIFAEGEVDRCPTGTGVSARMALHYKQGIIDINQPMLIESIIGTVFSGKALKTLTFENYDAVIPEVEGQAFITGKNEFIFDPDDNIKEGFILR